MSRPIAPTPPLGIRATKQFYQRVERDLKMKVGLVPTPKLNDAARLIIENAKRRAQQDDS